jgi:GntR family transcriptional regulator of vanillate catabolism
MSRIPVREALIRLAAEGMIQRNPGGGFKVHLCTLEEVEEAAELRVCLECFAVRLACRRGFSDARLVEMEQLARMVYESEQKREYRTAARADLEFHERLIGLANSTRLKAAVRGAHLQLFTWHSQNQKLLIRSEEETYRDHCAIVKYLRARDAEATAKILTEHILVGFDERIRAMVSESDFQRLRRELTSAGSLFQDVPPTP